ncbi:MAG: hypothetical protein ACRDLO_13105, partial [Solirubrobacterales bacterium]
LRFADAMESSSGEKPWPRVGRKRGRQWGALWPPLGRNRWPLTELHETIKSGLFGEAVEARIRARRPRPEVSIDPEHLELQLVSIRPGAGEHSGLGTSIDDMLDELEGA